MPVGPPLMKASVGMRSSWCTSGHLALASPFFLGLRFSLSSQAIYLYGGEWYKHPHFR